MAVENKPVAWMHPTAGWARTKYHSVLIHCQKDGPGPVPLYVSPQPETVITEEMVERSAKAILTEQEANRSAFPDNRDLARAALTAALILPTHKPLQEEG